MKKNENIEFDYRKLKGKIIEAYERKGFSGLAKDLGCTRPTMSFKLNGHSGFTQSDIYKICDLLGILISQMHEYFFVIKK